MDQTQVSCVSCIAGGFLGGKCQFVVDTMLIWAERDVLFKSQRVIFLTIFLKKLKEEKSYDKNTLTLSVSLMFCYM